MGVRKRTEEELAAITPLVKADIAAGMTDIEIRQKYELYWQVSHRIRMEWLKERGLPIPKGRGFNTVAAIELQRVDIFTDFADGMTLAAVRRKYKASHRTVQRLYREWYETDNHQERRNGEQQNTDE